MIASQSEIRILVYFQNIDAIGLETTLNEHQQIKKSTRSISPRAKKKKSLAMTESVDTH